MKCSICGKDESETRIINSKKYGVLCRKHYLQKYRHGSIFETIYDKNEVIYGDDYAEIVLKNKNGKIVGYAKIDKEDVGRVLEHKWHITNPPRTHYAITHIDENRKIFLHRFILDYYGPLDVDHINHDGLDNRKCNLRIVTHSRNLTNQYKEDKGVHKVKSGKYIACIMQDGKNIYLGTLDTKEEALKVRKDYEENLFC